MPAINPANVPSIAPGSIFTSLTTDNNYTVRWYTVEDPLHASVLNRPLADLEFQLYVVAKALDNLFLNVGHASTFPFLLSPQLNSGTQVTDIPLGFIWDLNISLPSRWSGLRLRKIQRISGVNTTTSGTSGDTYTFTGKLRLIFSGVEDDGITETALCYVDYDIEGSNTFQVSALVPLEDTTIDSPALTAAEINTVSGIIIFKALDLTSSTVQAFLLALDAPVNLTTGSDGNYLAPSVYEIADMVPGSTSGDFDNSTVTHGSGLLTSSAWNGVPPLQSDIQSFVNGINYPFQADANRKSNDNITLPQGLFWEFDIAAPAADQPTGDASGEFYPVWVSRIERIGTSDTIRLFFSTYNTTLDAPTTIAIEFAYADLSKTMVAGQVVPISSLDNLKAVTGTTAALNQQGFGLGHMVLSSIWGVVGGSIDNMYTAFDNIVSTPPQTIFSQAATRISSFGISRSSKFTPTLGQAEALVGSSERFTTPVEPSDTNRYVTESDQGAGNQVDLEAQPGITPSTALGRYGNSGSLCHRMVTLTVDQTKVPDGDATYYSNYILPRLTILLGRAPRFGDFWYDGTVLNFYNGSTWQGL